MNCDDVGGTEKRAKATTKEEEEEEGAMNHVGRVDIISHC